jgi:glutathione S-transferase
MSLTLYAHPFASYCWKVLIALYENETPFRYRMVDNAEVLAELEGLWPLKKFPVLKDGEASVIESSVIIEHLMLRYPGPTRLIPEGIDACLKVRFMDRFFDNYVMTPMQKLVSDSMSQWRARRQGRRRGKKDVGHRLWMARKASCATNVGGRHQFYDGRLRRRPRTFLFGLGASNRRSIPRRSYLPRTTACPAVRRTHS